MSYITGVGLTSYGKHEGLTSLDLMSMAAELAIAGLARADWTTGRDAILYQSCATCGNVQYFRRGFCAACGGSDLVEKRAGGEGRVNPTSLVCLPSTPEPLPHFPYILPLATPPVR